ncbi:hypothetical protein ACM66B_003941 [Microbotryomycetes sp. NB124-2]
MSLQHAFTKHPNGPRIVIVPRDEQATPPETHKRPVPQRTTAADARPDASQRAEVAATLDATRSRTRSSLIQAEVAPPARSTKACLTSAPEPSLAHTWSPPSFLESRFGQCGSASATRGTEQVVLRDPFGTQTQGNSFLETLAQAPSRSIAPTSEDLPTIETASRPRGPLFRGRPRSSSVPTLGIRSVSRRRKASNDERSSQSNGDQVYTFTAMRPSLSAPFSYAPRQAELAPPILQASRSGPTTLGACETYTFPKPRLVPHGSPPALERTALKWADVEPAVSGDGSSVRRVLLENEQSRQERQEWSSLASARKSRSSSRRRPSLKRLFAERHVKAAVDEAQHTPKRMSSLPQFAVPAPSPPVAHSFHGLAKSVKSFTTSRDGSSQGGPTASLAAATFEGRHTRNMSADAVASGSSPCSSTRYVGGRPIRHLHGSPSVDSLAPRMGSTTRYEFGQAITNGETAVESPRRAPTVQTQNAAVSLPPHLHHLLRSPLASDDEGARFRPSRPASALPSLPRRLFQGKARPNSMDSVQLCLALGDKLDQEQGAGGLGPRPPVVARSPPSDSVPISSVFPPRPATRAWGPTTKRRESRDDLARPTTAPRRTRSASSGATSVRRDLKENAGCQTKVKGLAIILDDPFKAIVLRQSQEFVVTSPVRSELSEDVVDLDDTASYAFDGLFFWPPAPSSSGHHAQRLSVVSSLGSSDRTSVGSAHGLSLGVATVSPTCDVAPARARHGLSAILGDDTFGPGDLLVADTTTTRSSSRASTTYETAVGDDEPAAFHLDEISLAPLYPRSELRLRTLRPESTATDVSSHHVPTPTSFLELGASWTVQESILRPASRTASVRPASEHSSFLDLSEDERGQGDDTGRRVGMLQVGQHRPRELDRTALQVTSGQSDAIKSPMGASFISDLLNGDTAMDNFPAPPASISNGISKSDTSRRDQARAKESWLDVEADEYYRDLYW